MMLIQKRNHSDPFDSSADLEAHITVPAAGSGNDILYGTANADTINGLAGNDVLSGQLGNDTLEGGAGNDALEGGDGSDIQLSRRHPGGKGFISKVRLRGVNRLDTVAANESFWWKTA